MCVYSRSALQHQGGKIDFVVLYGDSVRRVALHGGDRLGKASNAVLYDELDRELASMSISLFDERACATTVSLIGLGSLPAAYMSHPSHVVRTAATTADAASNVVAAGGM